MVSIIIFIKYYNFIHLNCWQCIEIYNEMLQNTNTLYLSININTLYVNNNEIDIIHQIEFKSKKVYFKGTYLAMISAVIF